MTTLTVTATQAGSPANGMGLRVMVITGAKPVASQAGGSAGTNFASGLAYTVSVTTTQTGSRVYGAGSIFNAVAGTAAANTTLIDDVLDSANSDQYITFKGTSLTGTPGATSFGFNASAAVGSAGPAAYEVLTAGTLAEDASGPAVASTTTGTTVTTASFTPPPGSLLVALIAADGNTGTETMTVTDSLGVHLNWTEKARNTASAGSDYAGVWIADVPASAAPGTPNRQKPALFRGRAPARGFVRNTAGTPPPVASGAVLTGAGSLTAPAVQSVTAALTGAGSVQASAGGLVVAGAALTGAGTLTALAVQRATAALTGAGTLTTAASAVTGLTVTSAPAAVYPSRPPQRALWRGTRGRAPSVTLNGTAALAGAGTLTAVSGGFGTATLTGAGTLTVPAVQQVTAALPGAGSLTATAVQAVTAPLAGAGVLTAVPGAFVFGTATLTGAGTLAAAGVHPGTAALGALGSLNATVIQGATAILAGAGSVTRQGTVKGHSRATVTDPREGTPGVTARATSVSGVT